MKTICIPVGRSSRNALIFTFALVVTASLPAQPIITVPPSDKTVRAGEPAFFTVTADSTPPLTYQWRKDGVDLLGATGSVCALGPARVQLAGNYSVSISDGNGNISNSSPAVLTVVPVRPGSVVEWDGVVPVPLEAKAGVVAISAGFRHTLALTKDGAVVAWGDNAAGQTDVPSGAKSNVIAISGGYQHSVALKADGSVLAWGDNVYGQATVPLEAQSGVIAIAAGVFHTVALKEDGSVAAWGLNQHGELTLPADTAGHIVAIAASYEATLALRIDGSVLEEGTGFYFIPREAEGRTVGIASVELINAALLSDGSVLTQYPTGFPNIRLIIQLGEGVTVVSGGQGYDRVCALRTDRRAYELTRAVSHRFDTLFGAQAVSGGYGHTTVLLGDEPLLDVAPTNAGLILSWSTNANGFRLQSTPTLSPALWTDVSTTSAIVDERFTVTNVASARSCFYRLTKNAGSNR